MVFLLIVGLVGCQTTQGEGTKQRVGTILGGVAGAVVGSSFGAIFVIVLTMYLLNKQTEIEQESKRSERVFDEKVQRVYQFCI